MTKPSCPQCGSKKPAPDGGRNYRCNRCGAIFDGNPAEGGTHFADPSKRMEFQEAEAARIARGGRR